MEIPSDPVLRCEVNTRVKARLVVEPIEEFWIDGIAFEFRNGRQVDIGWIVGLSRVSGSEDGHAGLTVAFAIKRAKIQTFRAGGVGKKPQLALITWCPANQVNEARDGATAIQSGGRAFDHFNLLEVERRDLKQSEAATESRVEGKAIFKDLGIAAIQTLDSYGGVGRCGRGLLRLYSRAFVQQHANVAGFHVRFFVELLSCDEFHARGHIGDGPRASR